MFRSNRLVHLSLILGISLVLGAGTLARTGARAQEDECPLFSIITPTQANCLGESMDESEYLLNWVYSNQNPPHTMTVSSTFALDIFQSIASCELVETNFFVQLNGMMQPPGTLPLVAQATRADGSHDTIPLEVKTVICQNGPGNCTDLSFEDLATFATAPVLITVQLPESVPGITNAGLEYHCFACGGGMEGNRPIAFCPPSDVLMLDQIGGTCHTGQYELNVEVLTCRPPIALQPGQGNVLVYDSSGWSTVGTLALSGDRYVVSLDCILTEPVLAVGIQGVPVGISRIIAQAPCCCQVP